MKPVAPTAPPRNVRGRLAPFVRYVVWAVGLCVLPFAVRENWLIWKMKQDPADTQHVPSMSPSALHHDCATCYFTALLLDKEGKSYIGMSNAEYRAEYVPRPPLFRDSLPRNPPPILLVYRLMGRIERTVAAVDAYRQHLYVVQLVAALAIMLLLTRWLPGWSLLLPILPILFYSIGWRENLHIGQAHLLMVFFVALASAALATRRERIGGVALGLAIMSHLHPGILLVPLAMRRRWRALGWTLGTLVGLLVVSIVVLGWPLNRDYFTRMLPHLLLHGELDLIKTAPGWVVSQPSPWGFVMKLRLLGVPLPIALATLLCKLWMLVVIGAAIVVGRRKERSDTEECVTFFALVVGALFTTVWMHPYCVLPVTVLAGFLLARELGADGIPRRPFATLLVAAIFALLVLRGTADPMLAMPSHLIIFMQLLVFPSAVFLVWLSLARPLPEAVAS